MECQQTAELLPWLINNTLTGSQREGVEAHLAGCPACRTRVGQAVAAGSIYSEHIPSKLLVDHAEGRSLTDDDLGIVTRHLEGCQDCADQLKMIRESWASLNSDEGHSPREPRTGAEVSVQTDRSFLSRFGALAAGLLLTVSLAGWLSIWLSPREAPSTPRINVLTVDVLPQRLTQRSTVTVEPLKFEASQDVTLILNSLSRQTYPNYDVEILDAGGAVIWSGSGLRRNPSGDYTISLPAGFLTSGTYELVVSPSSNPDSVETYVLEVG